MGNRVRFRLSDMMPNSWRLHKLKDTNKTTSANNNITRPASNNIVHPTNSSTIMNNIKSNASTLPHATANPRKSYHFPREVVVADPPRRSSKQAKTPKKSSKPPPPPTNKAYSLGNFSCRASTDSVWTRTTEFDPDDSPDSIIFGSSSPDFRLDRVLTPESRGSCGSRNDPSAVHDDHDVVIYVDNNSFVAKPKRRMLGLNHNSESFAKMELPRIITKPKQVPHDALDHSGFDVRDAKKPAKSIKEENGTGGRRKSLSRRHYSLSTSPRLRLKINSPKLSGRRASAQSRKTGTESSASSGRRKLSGSFAVVKSSFDPQRDFRESMVEMIVEHNIKASKDLEELLACYLSLNSDEYHELIIEVFKQIWFDLAGIHSIE